MIVETQDGLYVDVGDNGPIMDSEDLAHEMKRSEKTRFRLSFPLPPFWQTEYYQQKMRRKLAERFGHGV